MAYRISTSKSWAATIIELGLEMKRWGIINWDVNYPKGARLEGYNQSEQDRNVNLSYMQNGKTVKLSMGLQARATDNLRVLFLAIQSMRLNEKRGINKVLESAYLQLAGKTEVNPYEVLGVSRESSIEVCEAVYRTLALKAHPDKGGSVEKMKVLSEAIELIRREKNGTD